MFYLMFAAVSVIVLTGCSREEPLPGRVPASVQNSSEAPHDARPDITKVKPLKQGDEIVDAELVTHDGRKVKLSDYRGKVLVITFIYTRCNMPSMCPLVTAKLAEVASELRKGNVNGVCFLVVSFDVKFDKPEVLKAYAARYDVSDMDNFVFATGEEKQVAGMAKAFNVYYKQDQPGIFTHNIIVSVVDKDGILRDDFFSTGWDEQELIDVVRRLCEEEDK